MNCFSSKNNLVRTFKNTDQLTVYVHNISGSSFSIDDATREDACDNCVEVKVDDTVVVAASDGDPHITLKLPSIPPYIPGTEKQNNICLF